MTETFDAMTLVYLHGLLFGDDLIDNQSTDQLPLYKALEEAHKQGERVAEDATGSRIPLDDIDSAILRVVNRVFEDAFQLLKKKLP